VATLKIFMGSRNFSSWSLRAWLAFAQSELDFHEEVIPFHMTPGTRTYAPEILARISAVSPTKRVPVLHHGELVIPESSAICEYVSDLVPEARLWPDSVSGRAIARAISSEMHAGFVALRRHLPMSCRDSRTGPLEPPEVAQADIKRILSIWRECREMVANGGDFLFGRFSIADAMFAPVVSRFDTYAVPVDRVHRRYIDAVLDLPAMRKWMDDARQEDVVIPEIDRIIARYPEVIPGTTKI
jgi:glutathione S-transferase